MRMEIDFDSKESLLRIRPDKIRFFGHFDYCFRTLMRAGGRKAEKVIGALAIDTGNTCPLPSWSMCYGQRTPRVPSGSQNNGFRLATDAGRRRIPGC